MLKSVDVYVQSAAVQGLFFGSSSSVMFRLFGHGIVSEKYLAIRRTMQFKVAAPEAPFHRRNEAQKRQCDLDDFKRSVRLRAPTVKFKLSILMIRKRRNLLRAAL